MMRIHIKQYRDLLVKYLKPQWPQVTLLVVLILSGIALQLVSPQIVRTFIDMVTTDSEINELTVIAVLFLVVAITTQVVSLAVTYLAQNVAWVATNTLRLDLVQHCLRLGLSFHKAHTPGELIERVDGDVSELANFFSQMLVRLFGNSLLVLGILILLFVEDWRIGLVSGVYVLLTLGLLRQVQKPATKAWGNARQAYAELFGFLGERLVGTEDIRANKGEPYMMGGLYRLMRSVLYKARRAQLTGSLTFVVGYSAFMTTMIVTMGVGAVLFSRGLITIGTVYLLISYVSKLETPLQEIQRQIADLQRAVASVGRVTDLLHTRPTVVENVRAALPRGAALPVAFERVSFRYRDGAESDGIDNVLKNISFKLPPGKTLGLLGRTGSGKTTLTRLLLRLYDPDAGAINVGDVDIHDVSLSDLRERIGMVTQDVQLFEATIRNNLTFFDKNTSDEQVQAVLDELGLREWCASMPQGLDTELKAGGKSLSAGEAQLLALARVFLKNPGLVILDEASSRLDPATEQLLERAITRLLKDRTAIIIAHRLATVQRADEIMVLEDGRICEHGNRLALAHDSTSRFYSLLQIGLEEALA